MLPAEEGFKGKRERVGELADKHLKTCLE